MTGTSGTTPTTESGAVTPPANRWRLAAGLVDWPRCTGPPGLDDDVRRVRQAAMAAAGWAHAASQRECRAIMRYPRCSARTSTNPAAAKS